MTRQCDPKNDLTLSLDHNPNHHNRDNMKLNIKATIFINQQAADFLIYRQVDHDLSLRYLYFAFRFRSVFPCRGECAKPLLSMLHFSILRMPSSREGQETTSGKRNFLSVWVCVSACLGWGNIFSQPMKTTTLLTCKINTLNKKHYNISNSEFNNTVMYSIQIGVFPDFHLEILNLVQ